MATVPFVHGAFDSVFVKDTALLIHRRGHARALLAQPRHAERRIEQPARVRALRDRGFKAHEEVAASFEGGDVMVLPAYGFALLGTGFRSEKAAGSRIASFLEMPVHALELRDANLYHLDTAFMSLSDGTTAFCPEAFSSASVRWIERAFPATSLLRVAYPDALGFALNVIEVGRHVILGGASLQLETHLARRGWSTHVPNLDQFRRAGGSAACLVSRIHRPETPAASAPAPMHSVRASAA